MSPVRPGRTTTPRATTWTARDRDYRRVRIYLYQRQTDDETRESVRRAAQREYRAGRGIEHPGLLVPDDLQEHDLGPALLIRQHPQAVRLDHWLVRNEKALDLPTRVGLVRQLAEAVGYAHQQRLVHRALSPRAVVVEPREEGPRLKVGEWQAAARGLSSSRSEHRVEPTSHVGQHVEAAAQAYLAPEFTQPADGTTAIDVFELGASSYLLLTGKPPAQTRTELFERLRVEDGLRPYAVDDSIPPDLDLLVALATCPTVTQRPDDVDQFLALLTQAEEASRGSIHPPTELDPLDAQAAQELPEGYQVIRPLGTGSTARACDVGERRPGTRAQGAARGRGDPARDGEHRGAVVERRRHRRGLRQPAGLVGPLRRGRARTPHRLLSARAAPRRRPPLPVSRALREAWGRSSPSPTRPGRRRSHTSAPRMPTRSRPYLMVVVRDQRGTLHAAWID